MYCFVPLIPPDRVVRPTGPVPQAKDDKPKSQRTAVRLSLISTFSWQVVSYDMRLGDLCKGAVTGFKSP